MTEDNKIEIPLSKAKLVMLIAIGVAFVAAGLWLILAAPQTRNLLLNIPFVKTGLGCASVLLGGSSICFASKKLFDKNPGLMLSEQGVYHNVGAFSFGLIPWSDVTKIYEGEIQASPASKQRYVVIGLSDPYKYISRESNVIRKKLLQTNLEKLGSPVLISTIELKTKHKDLLSLVSSYFEKYKQPI